MNAPTGTTIDSHDITEIEHLMRSAGAPSRIIAARDGAKVPFTFHSLSQGDGEMSLTRYRAGGRWSMRSDADLHTVTSATTATPRWARGDDRGDFVDAPVHLSPGTSTVEVDGGTDVFEIRFTADAVGRLAADVHGVEHVRLGAGTTLPRTPAHRQYWQTVVDYTRRLFDSGALRDEHLLAALKANLAATLLDGFALMEGVREWRLTPAGAQEAFRRARAFVEASATSPVAAPDVARAAGLPLALLDQHFRAQTGGGVAEYLQTARVLGARAQLIRGGAEPDAVARVVQRWGFTSIEAFLALHRRLRPGRPLPFEG